MRLYGSPLYPVALCEIGQICSRLHTKESYMCAQKYYNVFGYIGFHFTLLRTQRNSSLTLHQSTFFSRVLSPLFGQELFRSQIKTF